MAWPKVVEIGGIKVPVDSWAELREAIQELGGDIVVTEQQGNHAPKREDNGSHASAIMHPNDRTLLLQFIETGERGLLTQQIGHALGAKGKGVRPALNRWSRKLGLVNEDNAVAFEAIKRFDGRGFKMIEHYRRTASAMLGMS